MLFIMLWGGFILNTQEGWDVTKSTLLRGLGLLCKLPAFPFPSLFTRAYQCLFLFLSPTLPSLKCCALSREKL